MGYPIRKLVSVVIQQAGMTEYVTKRETIIAGIVIPFDSPFFFAVVDLYVLFALIFVITAKAISVLGDTPNLEQSIIGDYP